MSVTCCGGPHSILPESADLTRLGNLSPKAAAEAMLRLFITDEFISENPDFFQQLVAFTVEHSFSQTSLQKHTQAITNHNTYDRLPGITVPTLILAGGADRIIPADNSILLKKRIPNAELIIFKNAGHMLVEAGNDPHQVAIDFLRKHQGQRM